MANIPDAADSVGRNVADLVRRTGAANAALMRGDGEVYAAAMGLAEDFLLMSPFGGEPSRDYTLERLVSMADFFHDGSFSQEVVGAWGTADMVTLALIEHCDVAVGDLPKQDWFLRVTLVFRRDGDAWSLVHRHADPLAAGIGHAESAALAAREPA